ncbi:hypothetical protein HanXRQr2_Chr17g0821151 [Helianthus annuus]|uniref:Uncharacterized protein n=1 Tax=Helianthus annuus TaxID=4232 RepID=A0A9K3DMI4_HELAN|nr:hypothetical protein HanXRQr2_Chr17g0821151 [Helianthus annuus]KAJ0637519.1 hypothetical protein HanOQP8_Chr17g0674861 [Helianthus annuus]
MTYIESLQCLLNLGRLNLSLLKLYNRSQLSRSFASPAPQPAQRPPLDPSRRSQLSRSFASPKEGKSLEAED